MASWEYTPTFRGFSSHFGFYNGATNYYSHCHPEQRSDGPLDLHRSSAPNTPAAPITNLNGSATQNVSDYGPFVFARETNRVIGAHVAATTAGKGAGGAVSPMFLYLTHQSVHEPLQAPEAYIDRCSATVPAKFEERRTFCGMVAALDDAIYEVTSHLAALQLWADTLFVFQAGESVAH
jgi:arylsulfatase B